MCAADTCTPPSSSAEDTASSALAVSLWYVDDATDTADRVEMRDAWPESHARLSSECEARKSVGPELESTRIQLLARGDCMRKTEASTGATSARPCIS